MELKEIHSFEVTRKVEKEVTEETEQGKLTKTVEVQEPLRVIIKKPSRPEAEQADEEYAIEYARCVRLNMLTDALIDKRYANEHGFLSDDDQERYARQYVKFLELQKEFQYLSVKEKKSKKDEERIKEITKEWFEIETDLEELQAARNSLYAHTAETKARDKTITYLSLTLTYIQEEGKEPVPYYKGKNLEEKLVSYDKIVDGDQPHDLEIIAKSSLYISLWYMNKLKTPEDFKNFEAVMINRAKLPEPDKKAEKVKTEDKPKEKTDAEQELPLQE